MMNLYFDTIIFTSIILAALLMILLYRETKLDRRPNWYLGILIGIVAAGTLILVYGSFIESRIITTKQENIILNESGQNIKIAFIADLHVGPYKKSGFVERVAEKIIDLDPDILLIGGDNIFGGKEDAAKYLSGFRKTAEKIPVFAVSGNHEYNIGRSHHFETFFDMSDEVGEVLENAGVDYLQNEARLIEIRDRKFWLLGIDSVFADLDDLEHALKFTDDNYPKIVLAHNPDLIMEILEKNYDIDLLLTGHTHGGQIRLPLLGALPPLPVKIGDKYDEGLFRLDDIYLYITSGIGEAGARARLFNPPEIVVLDLKI